MLKHPPRCAGGVGLIPGGRTETSRVTEHVGPHGITGEPLHSRRRAHVTQRRPHVPHLRADPDKRTVYLLKKKGDAGDVDSIPGWGTKIPHAAGCSQNLDK